MRGKFIPLSLPRRTVIDLLHFASAIPTVPVQRLMSLQPVVSARAACSDRPRWTAIFVKAYALAAREFPELRRAYIKLPWPTLYEYPLSNASIIKDPAARPLDDIGEILRHASTAPIDAIKDFQRSMRFAALPRPLRRLLWWVALNFGRQRSNFFGTFAVSVYSGLNAESLHPLTPLTTTLNYGVIDGEGKVTVRVIYDHRVVNGATVARALARLEEILNTSLVEEIRSQPVRAQAS